MHTRLAQQYLREKRPDLAIPELREVVALDPNNVDARGNLGVLLFFRGDYANAALQLRAALKLQPDLWKIQGLLGLSERRIGESSEGREDLEAAFPYMQDEKFKIEVGNNLIDSYTSTGDLDKAATTVSAMLKLQPTDVNLLYTAYRLYSDLADQSMLTMALTSPNSAQMHQVMAHELARHGDTDAAIANYRQAIKLDPKLPGLHFELAEILNNSEDPSLKAQAEAEYRAALAINPMDEKSELALGNIAAKRGDLKEAYDDDLHALKLQPNDAEAHTDLAKVLMSMNQPQKAQKLLEQALQIDPTDYVAHYRLSTLYARAGRPADAKHELEEYKKYKDLKDQLSNIFHQMRVESGKNTRDDSDAEK
ncbi:MAG TPA: tetratricopeptide repeat protein [Acidobacteriaceae bacterium]|nr:tetratricopeptide repeat protein [Acidobacteriaceae bacterium]